MAKQEGSLQVTGTIDNLSHIKTKNGLVTKTKGGVSGKRIATDENYIRMRETQVEFSGAGKAGKLIRNAIAELLIGSSDHLLTSRLVRLLMTIVKSDPINGRGLRNVTDGDITRLRNFEFNQGSPLSTTLLAQTSATINRATGELVWRVPSMVPQKLVAAPREATHYKIITAAIEADFRKFVSICNINASAELPLNELPTVELEMMNRVTANSPHVLLLVAGVQFYQKILNGTLYPLNNTAFNALKIVEVNKV